MARFSRCRGGRDTPSRPTFATDPGPGGRSARRWRATRARRRWPLLEKLAGGRLRLGFKVGVGAKTMPFPLAQVGGRVAVEATDAQARTTFVFAWTTATVSTPVLLLTSFRREALWLPPERLGRWALAVRMLEVVRWARAALVARVVHDARWETEVRSALA